MILHKTTPGLFPYFMLIPFAATLGAIVFRRFVVLRLLEPLSRGGKKRDSLVTLGHVNARQTSQARLNHGL